MSKLADMFSINERHILITGASSGIGREIAVILAQQGAILGLSGRNTAELEKTSQMLEGDRHYIIPADLSKVDDTSDIFERALQAAGKLDGLVYSAGVIPTVPLQMTTMRKNEEVFRVNFFAFVDMVRNYAKPKFSRGGSIVGISSIASVKPEKGQTIYAASKAAMNTAVEAIAQEIYSKGIRINTILPGITQTTGEQDDNLQLIVQQQLLGWINPADIGKLCVYLLNDAAKSVSGRRFYIDGARF